MDTEPCCLCDNHSYAVNFKVENDILIPIYVPASLEADPHGKEILPERYIGCDDPYEVDGSMMKCHWLCQLRLIMNTRSRFVCSDKRVLSETNLLCTGNFKAGSSNNPKRQSVTRDKGTFHNSSTNQNNSGNYPKEIGDYFLNFYGNGSPTFHRKKVSNSDLMETGSRKDISHRKHQTKSLEKMQRWHPSILLMGYTSFLTLTREDSNYAHRKYMAQLLKQFWYSTKSRLRKALYRAKSLSDSMGGERVEKCWTVLQGDIELFEEPGGPSKVMITACAQGISLTAASRVILLDSEWNPSESKQAIARAFRPGQSKVVYVYQLLATGTLEEEKHGRPGPTK